MATTRRYCSRSRAQSGRPTSSTCSTSWCPKRSPSASRALNWADLWTVVRGLGAGERTWAAEVALDGIGERLCGVSACSGERWYRCQPGQPHQVVCGCHQIAREVHTLEPRVAFIEQATDCCQ